MIRNLSFVMAALLLSIATAVAQNDWQDGNEAYRQGDYHKAVSHYEQLLADGNVSADLYYNLGNAYYRDGQMGRAILNYERSLLLRPNSRDARENLAIAQDKTVDHIQPLPRVQLRRSLLRVVQLFGPRGWRIVVLLLATLTGAALVVRRIAADKRWRKRGFICMVVAALLLAIAATCACISQHRLVDSNRLVVLEPEAAVHSAPESNSNLLFVVHEGTVVDIEESLGDWHRIRLADGNNGWIRQADGEEI